jgi:hypothetical protein
MLLSKEAQRRPSAERLQGQSNKPHWNSKNPGKESARMKNRQKKVLEFPKPLEEPVARTIVCQIGDERFAIRYEIEDLPPTAPLVLSRRGTM